MAFGTDKCGVVPAQNIKIDYDLTLRLKIAGIVISPKISSSASFQCPISASDIDVSLPVVRLTTDALRNGSNANWKMYRKSGWEDLLHDVIYHPTCPSSTGRSYTTNRSCWDDRPELSRWHPLYDSLPTTQYRRRVEYIGLYPGTTLDPFSTSNPHSRKHTLAHFRHIQKTM